MVSTIEKSAFKKSLIITRTRRVRSFNAPHRNLPEANEEKSNSPFSVVNMPRQPQGYIKCKKYDCL